MLGMEAGTKLGTDLGLTNDWVVQHRQGRRQLRRRFERNVGQGSPLKIARGLNALWSKGGLQYAPPIR
jgi:general L-amino acid transport system substrate-binding protein